MEDLVVGPVEVAPARPVQAREEESVGAEGPAFPVKAVPPIRVHAINGAISVVPSPEAGFLDRKDVVLRAPVEARDGTTSGGPARPIERTPPIRNVLAGEGWADSPALALPVTPSFSSGVAPHGDRAVEAARAAPRDLSSSLVDHGECDTLDGGRGALLHDAGAVDAFPGSVIQGALCRQLALVS